MVFRGQSRTIVIILIIVILALPTRTLFFVVLIIIIGVVGAYVRASRKSRTNLLTFGEPWIMDPLIAPFDMLADYILAW